MATSPQSLEAQINNKWHHSFARLNRGEPGVSGLISFSEVGHSVFPKALLFANMLCIHRHGWLQRHFSFLEI